MKSHFVVLLLLVFILAANARRYRYGNRKRHRYSPRTSCGSVPLSCSERELNDLGKQIWREDRSRIPYGSGYTMDMQANAVYSGADRAPRPLFRYVSSDVLRKPTFKAMIALFDNYNREVGRSEYVPSRERSENWNFINAVINTKPMQLVYNFLSRKKIVCSVSDFRRKLHYIWFDLYNRRSSRKRYTSASDSSGFEHVFVGETDSSKVLGLHNWIQFYLQEKSRKIDYRGYKGLIKRTNLFTCQFSWYGKMKWIGGAMVGVSPEFDFALYSLTFLSRVRNPVYQFGSDRVQVKCYSIANGKIGTCYPILL